MRWLVLAILLSAFAGPAGPPIAHHLHMSDDHAAHAISGYGSRRQHQPKSSSRREGMMLRKCLCTNSICTPSLAADPTAILEPEWVPC